MGDQEGRNVEDVEGSGLDTLRKGSSLMSWMMLFYPKEDILKVSFGYVYLKCFRNGGSRIEVLEGR